MGCPYAVFGLTPDASLADVKSCYIKLAKAHHPDKLAACTNDAERLEHTEKFRRATLAYRCIEDTLKHGGGGGGLGGCKFASFGNDSTSTDWWGSGGGGLDEWIKVFRNVFDEMKKRYHSIEVPVTLRQIHKRKVRRLEIFLRDCDDPVYISVNCGEYPNTTTIADEGRIIKIKFVLKQHEIYHLDNIIGNRDIFATCSIQWHDYIQGALKTMTWIDGKTIIDISIPPFADLEIPLVFTGRGLWGEGNLYVSLKVQYPLQAAWNLLAENDQKDMVRLLTLLTT